MSAFTEVIDSADRLVTITNEALRERDAERELCETWSAMSCDNAIEVGRQNAEIARLRRGLKEALDHLCSHNHDAALALRREYLESDGGTK